MNRYLVTTLRRPSVRSSVIKKHATVLDRLRVGGQLELGGPYILWAENLEEARALALSDPVHTTGSSIVTVHEWGCRKKEVGRQVTEKPGDPVCLQYRI
jgi:uncharacterized protein YciI